MITNSGGWTGGSTKTIKHLSDDEVRRFFEAVQQVKDPATRARDLCLFHLMLSLGLRCAEVKLLRCADVDLKATPARIFVTRVKKKCVTTVNGEKVRVERKRDGAHYDLSESDEQRLTQWLKHRRGYSHSEETDHLFVTRQASAISTNSVNFLTHKYGRVAGMSAIYPHQFRHTCGIRLARKGLSAFEIKERLGHVSVLSSEVYVTIAGPEKVKMDRRANAAIEGDEED
jgi:integrase